jgi:hypothetical protein
MTISGMIKVLNDELFLKLNNTLDLIEKFQGKMNIILNDKQLDEIEVLYTNFFTGIYTYLYTNNLSESAKRYVGENLANNVTNSITMNSSINNINRIVKKEIDEIKIKNKVKQDEPSINKWQKSHCLLQGWRC